MELTFKTSQPDFKGGWLATLQLENKDFTLHYINPDGGDYASDKAAGTLSRRNLMLVCKPKNPLCDVTLNLMAGLLALSLNNPPMSLTLQEAGQLIEDISSAMASAAAMEDFITERFGPVD